MTEAMQIGWTQNVVILEADLTIEEKAWYIRAARKFGWSKLKLLDTPFRIFRYAEHSHLTVCSIA